MTPSQIVPQPGGMTHMFHNSLRCTYNLVWMYLQTFYHKCIVVLITSGLVDWLYLFLRKQASLMRNFQEFHLKNKKCVKRCDF